MTGRPALAMMVSRGIDPVRILMAAALAVLLLLPAHRPAIAQSAMQTAGPTFAQRLALQRIAAHSGVRPRAAQATEAADTSLARPSAVAYDSSGNVYIADTGNHIVRQVTALGAITTVAGSGQQGFAGDGGAATSAWLDSPSGIAIDAAGNLYISDTHNHRIRKVTAGTITTIAGTGAAGFSGDGGGATSAQLNLPTALAVDSAGNLYVADTNNHRIRKISGATITTVAGDGDQLYSGDGVAATRAGLDSPNGIAVDAAGNLYIGDTHNQRVRMVSASTGVITTIAGNGAAGFSGDGSGATLAALAGPRGLALSATGNLYIADSDNNRVRSLAPGGTISTAAGNGVQGFAGDTGPAAAASFNTPRAVAASPADSLAIADTGNQRLREFRTLNSETLAGVGAPGSIALLLSAPTQVVAGNGTLTATLSNGPSGAAGTITFLDVTTGVVALGQAPLANGSGSISLATLSAGTHLFAARYQSDGNVPALTSGVVGVEVLSNDFTISVAPPSASVIPGDTAAFTVTVVAAGSALGSTVSLTAGGVPAGATVNFAPAAIEAGSQQTSQSILTIQTAALTARLERREGPPGIRTVIRLACLPFLLLFSRHRRLARRWKDVLLPCLLPLVLFSISGCGSGVNPNAHPPKTYAVTVTGTSASGVSHSASVTLTIL